MPKPKPEPAEKPAPTEATPQLFPFTFPTIGEGITICAKDIEEARMKAEKLKADLAKHDSI